MEEGKDGIRKRVGLTPSGRTLRKRSPNFEAAPNINSSNTSDNGKENWRYVPTDWDDSLPYGGKVYLARKKKPQSFLCILLQVIIVVGTLGFLYYGWYYTEHLHYHTTKLYARMGHKDAQALIGHKLLHGKGVEKNHTEAMEWLYEAAKQGHPHSAYNVAVGHLQGLKTALKPGEVRKLIEHAAMNGVEEAIDVLEHVCSQGKCDI